MLFQSLVAGCLFLVVSGASISLEQGNKEDATVRKLRNNRHKRQLDWYYPGYGAEYYYPQYDSMYYPYYEPEYYPQYYPKYEPVTYPKYEPVTYPKYEPPVHYPKYEPVHYPKYEPVYYPKYETTPYPKYETTKPCKTTTHHYYTTTPPPPPQGLIPAKLGLVNQLGNDKQNLLNTKLGLLLGTTTVAPYHYY